jgi:hypothetical protein
VGLGGYIKRRRKRKRKKRELGGVGSGEKFEGACKRRHGGGPDLNFYLLLAPIPQLSSAHL